MSVRTRKYTASMQKKRKPAKGFGSVALNVDGIIRKDWAAWPSGLHIEENLDGMGQGNSVSLVTSQVPLPRSYGVTLRDRPRVAFASS